MNIGGQTGEFSFKRLLADRFGLDRDPDIPKLSWRLVSQLWELSAPFWKRPDAWVSYIALAYTIAYGLGFAVVSAKIAKLTGDQLDTLAQRDTGAFYRVIVLALIVQVGLSFFSSISSLVYQILLQRWREWLSQSIIRDYLRDSNYYVLNRDRAVDNPDERIAIDIAQFVMFPVQLLLGIVQCISSLAVFGYILWSFSWYLLPACAVFYLIQSVLALVLSKPILSLSYTQRRLDGDFRFSLVNVRVNAESVAFLGGERVEQRELFHRLRLLVQNFIKSYWWTSALVWWLGFSSNLASLVPGILIAPLILSGALTLTAFTQVQNAWGQLGNAFGFIGDQALALANGGAVIARLHNMLAQMKGTNQADRGPQERIRHHASSHLAARHFSLSTPGGERVLVKDLSFELEHGGRLLITGSNGAGKSSLLRGIAGLWTRGAGDLYRPAKEKTMFLPQRPYMSLGTFREQVSYPDNQETFPDEVIRKALENVHLGHLEERVGGMEAKLDWMHVLSPGEQQRIAFARVLLRRPELVILDEATSAIDVEGEQLLYRLLQEMGSTYVSVAHRVSLVPFHRAQLALTGEGGWKLTEMALPDGRDAASSPGSLPFMEKGLLFE